MRRLAAAQAFARRSPSVACNDGGPPPADPTTVATTAPPPVTTVVVDAGAAAPAPAPLRRADPATLTPDPGASDGRRRRGLLFVQRGLRLRRGPQSGVLSQRAQRGRQQAVRGRLQELRRLREDAPHLPDVPGPRPAAPHLRHRDAQVRDGPAERQVLVQRLRPRRACVPGGSHVRQHRSLQRPPDAVTSDIAEHSEDGARRAWQSPRASRPRRRGARARRLPVSRVRRRRRTGRRRARARRLPRGRSASSDLGVARARVGRGRRARREHRRRFRRREGSRSAAGGRGPRGQREGHRTRRRPPSRG